MKKDDDMNVICEIIGNEYSKFSSTFSSESRNWLLMDCCCY